MMYKQKIVLEVEMYLVRNQKKIRKIAASVDGFLSMDIDTSKNQLILVGVGIETAHLVNSLKKKVGFTKIISIEIVKSDEEKKEEEAEKKNKEEEAKKKKEEEELKYRIVNWNYEYRNNFCPPPLAYDLVYYGSPSRHPNTWFNW
ncbi:hypothetical protein QQ045_008888 [Rhodiola kirilowii]